MSKRHRKTVVTQDLSKKLSSSWRSRLNLCRFEDRCVPAGLPLGPQFFVAPTYGVPESTPAVAVVNPAGDFVASWQSFDQDGSGFGVFLQRFQQDGTPVDTAPVLVNAKLTHGDQTSPSISTDGNGNFVIAWQSEPVGGGTTDIYFRMGDFATGLRFGDEQLVNVTTTGTQQKPAVSMDSNGSFVIAWETDQAAGGDWDIYDRFGTLAGGLLPGENAVAVGEGAHRAPAVDLTALDGPGNGQLVVVYQGPGASSEGEPGVDLFANLYQYTPAFATVTPSKTAIAVNAVTDHDQVTPAVAMDSTGQFVVAWEASGQQGSGSDVFARRFNAQGVPTDMSEFLVNVVTSGPQRAPDVAADAAGNFLVAWQSVQEDGISWSVQARPYSAGGQAISAPFLLNDLIQQGPQTSPALSMASNGQAVALWLGPQIAEQGDEGAGGHKPGVHAHRLSNAGQTEIGNEFLIAITSGIEEAPAPATIDSHGNFVVVWQSYQDASDTSGFGVYAQRLDNHGMPTSPAFLVNNTTTGYQSNPAVAGNGVGNLVVVWQSETQSDSGYDIFARVYGTGGEPLGPEFRVNTFQTGRQTNPTVAMDGGGDFIVAWQSEGQDGSGTGIYGQRFAVDGTPVGTEFAVNTFTANDQVSPQAAMNKAGELGIVWVSDHPAVTDPNDTEKSIFVRWYNAAGIAVGPEFPANVYVKDAQEYPGIGLDMNGNMVVTWQSINQEKNQGVTDGTSWGVYARQFRPDGSSPQTSEFLVNSTVAGPQRFPSVGVDAAGRFNIIWQSNHQDGSSWGIYQRQFQADATPETGEQLVNTWTEGPQILPVVARAPGSDYGVFWLGSGTNHTEGVQGRIYRVNSDYLVAGAGTGGMPLVQQYNVDGTLHRTITAYDESFRGGVHVATGDITGDGIPDVITGAGENGGPHVRAFDGVTGNLIRDFFAYDASFRGGVFVAAGDVNFDGIADIITGAGYGGGPHVRVFDGNDARMVQEFFAYSPSFQGGVSVAVGDVTGDGVGDIVTGAGRSGGPHVRAFSGANLSLVRDFFAYDASFRGGVFVAASDVTGDGVADIVTGAGESGGPHVRAFDGTNLKLVSNFYAYSASFTGGVRVATVDLDGDRVWEIATGPGQGGSPDVRFFAPTTGRLLEEKFVFDPEFLGGVWVG
ncbi:MAG: hypothetical protein K1X57_06070 [Gemmataceae bacterium]|nr:hypothetical protein [Gemmataceae bacterium]